MLQERVEVLIRTASVFAAEVCRFFGVGPVNGGDFDSGDGKSGAGVGLRDIAATDKADMDSHVIGEPKFCNGETGNRDAASFEPAVYHSWLVGVLTQSNRNGVTSDINQECELPMSK